MIALRDVLEGDLEHFYEHQADPAAAAMAGFRSRDRDAFYLHWRTKVLPNSNSLKKTVLVDGAVAGNVLVFDLEGRKLVGYWIGRPWWGKGVATAACAQVLKLEPHRPLHAWVIPTNTASMRVLEKNGFVRGPQRVDHAGVLEVLFTLG